jgi:hypothetical protein
MTDQLSALHRIADKLRKAGATVPFPTMEGTIESSMRTGLSHALLLVEEEIEAAAQPVASAEDLIDLLRDIRPEYGAVGSRDVDVTEKRQKIDAAIVLLSAAQPVASVQPDTVLLQDAARYRWIRDQRLQTDVCGTDEREEFDAAIDAAMKENK